MPVRGFRGNTSVAAGVADREEAPTLALRLGGAMCEMEVEDERAELGTDGERSGFWGRGVRPPRLETDAALDRALGVDAEDETE